MVYINISDNIESQCWLGDTWQSYKIVQENDNNNNFKS